MSATSLLKLCLANNLKSRGTWSTASVDWVNLAGEHCRSMNNHVINFDWKAQRYES